MTIVSVINYKGGVGKTTVTANLGAELARRGGNVLLIDLDPQASLTFSFVKPEFWERDLEAGRTIKQWFESFQADAIDLKTLMIRPGNVATALRRNGSSGSLRLIPSHLGLINVDLELATELGGANLRQNKSNYVKVHRRLADELLKPDYDEFDIVLIDCPPNFNIVTKTAIVASDKVVVPAKADYLSTLGIDYLQRSLRELVSDYNAYMAEGGGDTAKIAPELIGVIFTMVQMYAGQPIATLRDYIQRTKKLGVPVFDEYFRENKTQFGTSAEEGVPLVLDNYSASQQIRSELGLIVDEFTSRVGL